MKLLTDEFLELLLAEPGDLQPNRAKKTDKTDDKSDDKADKARTKGDGDGNREAA
jgi:hypothetical protein